MDHPIQVRVANGDMLSSKGKSMVVGVSMQGTVFTVDFFLL